MIAAFIDKRMKGGAFGGRELEPVSERTANLDLLILRNVLKAAMDDGHLRELPRLASLKIVSWKTLSSLAKRPLAFCMLASLTRWAARRR